MAQSANQFAAVNVNAPAESPACTRRLVAPDAEFCLGDRYFRRIGSELDVEDLTGRDIDIDVAVVGELSWRRDHGREAADHCGPNVGGDVVFLPTVDSDGRHRSAHEKNVLRRSATHRAGRHLAAEQGDIGPARAWFARDPQRSSLLIRQERARVHPFQADLPGARGEQDSGRRRRCPSHHRRAPGREHGRHEEGRETHRATVTQRRCRASHAVQGCRTPCRAVAPAGRGASARRDVRHAVSVEPWRRKAPPAARSSGEARAGSCWPTCWLARACRSR